MTQNKRAFTKSGFIMNTEQIARLANVSRSTVSRVLNNYKNVPEKTRLKVQAVIDEFGYTPNHFARSLAGASSNIVGVFISDINDTNSSDDWVGINSPYNMELLSNIVSILKSFGYTTLVNIITDPSEFKKLEELFVTRMICGGIFTGFPYKAKELTEIALKYNAVFIDQFSELDVSTSNIKIVNCDNLQGGYEATKFLIENGHHSILHIEGDNRLSSINRKLGYLKALNDFGNLESHCITGMYKEDIAYNLTKEYLKDHSPTAIFAANDIMALGAIRAIEELGYKVPDDFSVVGFDNLKVSTWLKLDLTSFEVSLKDVAGSCIKLLLNKDIEKMVHSAILVEKGSVKKI